MDYDVGFRIGDRVISNESPTYFIADIGANHDGSLSRAKDLIKLASTSGVDCVKFQHFKAEKIVSAVGFEGMRSAHQRNWDKSVFEVYADASINPDWNYELYATAQQAGIDFMTTPYDIDSTYEVDRYVEAFKIGSGDITYLSHIRSIAFKKKPVFLATGASAMAEVVEAVENILPYNRQLCLMQCNTNYTGDFENIRHVNLKVLQSYAARWPGLPLGLSDHTHGNVSVLGAVALGVRVVEKHFTDDISRRGPDHSFAMSKLDWAWMVQQVRELEAAMGDGKKKCEDNEVESRVVQRRAIRLKKDYPKHSYLTEELDFLRPCPNGAYTPAQVGEVIGRRLRHDMKAGQEIYPDDLV